MSNLSDERLYLALVNDFSVRYVFITMKRGWSSSFGKSFLSSIGLGHDSGNGRGVRSAKIALLLAMAATVFISLSLTFPCLLIRLDDGNVFRAIRVRSADTVILSHVNSIYDAEVHETLVLSGDTLCVHKVETASEGVREYYGIAEGLTERCFASLLVRNSRDRRFTLTLNGNIVEELETWKDAAVRIEVASLPWWRYLLVQIGLGSFLRG